MTFENLASIMLGVAAIVVGIVLPLAGGFAFVFLRGDIKYKVKKFISKQIKKGRIHRQVEDVINSALKDEEGILRQYINAGVREAIAAQNATAQIEAQNAAQLGGKIEWGYEADEHGEEPRPKGKKA